MPQLEPPIPPQQTLHSCRGRIISGLTAIVFKGLSAAARQWRIILNLTLIGILIAAFGVVWVIYFDIQSRLPMDPKATSVNIFDTDFILTNHGRLWLYDGRAWGMLLVLDVPNVVVTDTGRDTVIFSPPYEPVGPRGPGIQTLGDIPPLTHRTIRIPMPFTKASEVWRFAHVCIHVSYHVFPWRQEQKLQFGFMADRKAGIEHWISQPCQGSHYKLRPISSGEVRLYIRSMYESTEGPPAMRMLIQSPK